jgi:ribose transport system ATP-binding protein
VYDTSTNDPAGRDAAGAADVLVAVRGLRKRFGGVPALTGVDLDLRRGSVLALLGQNGAGKSTLIKILAGVHRPDEGEVTVAGRPFGTPAAARAMAFIHQDLGLVDWMTVAENIALGIGYPRRAGLISWRRVRRLGHEALQVVGGGIDPRARVAELSRADRSLVAIARALATDAEVIALDEPTASLPAADRERLFEVLRVLCGRGHGILYVTHRLDEVAAVADAVAVLRDGRVVARRPVDRGPGGDRWTPDLTRALVRDVVGEDAGVVAGPPPPPGDVVLDLIAVRAGRAGPVSLRLRAGELVGLCGLTGAGHTDVGRALAGARPLTGGQVLLGGRPYRPRTVAEAVAAGVGLVTDDRLADGLAPDLTVRENLLANPRAQAGVSRTGPRWIRPGAERAEAAARVARLGVRPPDTEAPVTALSGGNQQKVVLGSRLGMRLRVLVLEEPTAGVDVGAKAELHHLLDDTLAAGRAVLLVSADLGEIAHVCHRAVVFVGGTVVEELSGVSLTLSGLTRAASAGSTASPGTAGT